MNGEARARGYAHGLSRLSGDRDSPVAEPQRRRAARAGERWLAHRAEGEAWRRRSLELWRKALAAAADGELPTEPHAGKLIVSLGDRRVRDAVLVSLVPGAARTADRLVAAGSEEDAAAALDAILNVDRGRAPERATCEALWRLGEWLTALARNDARAPLLTLCGLMAWWEGDSGEAAQLVDAALAAEPSYRLAQLMQCTLLAGIAPGWLRAA